MKKVMCFILAVLLLPVIKPRALSVSAKAAVVINGDTSGVLFAHNMDEKLPMASTTKIMTAMLLCEQNDMEKEVVVTKEMVSVEGSSMGLLVGDTVSYRSLLYGMLLASGNDAANTAAVAIDGSVEKFVERMNARAQQLGLVNTHFETPSGLDGDTHYTTAYELALLTKEAMKNEYFAEACAVQYETLYYGNPPYRRTLRNHNRLLGMFDSAVGVKTGFTKKSGRCLVSAAKKDGKFVIAVTLNDGDDWHDHISMLQFGLDSLETHEITPQKEYAVPSVSDGKSVVGIVPKIDVTTNMENEISSEVYLPNFLYLPIKEGEAIGSIVCYENGKILKTESILAAQTVEMPQTKFIKKFLCIFTYLISNL